MRDRDLIDPQPAPAYRPGAPSMHDLAARLHELRRDHGLAVYGSLLQTGNGRDPSIDRVQEALDGLVYQLQDVLERSALADALAQFRLNLVEIAGRDEPRAAGARWALDLFGELTGPAAITSRADEKATVILRSGPGGDA